MVLRIAQQALRFDGSPSRDADTADKILKPGIASEGVESGIHPDPGDSSGSLKESLLHGLKSFFLFSEVRVGIRDNETADVFFLGLLQGVAEKLSGLGGLARPGESRCGGGD